MLDLLFGRAGSRRGDGGAFARGEGMFRGGRIRTLAGPVVDEDLALTYSAVWCATRILAEATASLPLVVYRRSANGDRQEAHDFYLSDLLRYQPNPKMSATPFREGRTAHQVNWGQGFAEIERNLLGETVAKWPIHPSRVSPVRPADDEPDYDYWVRNNDGSRCLMKAEDMLHFPGALSEDGIWGKGVIQYARESIGFGLGTERHGASYFGGGAQPKGVVNLPGLQDPEKRRSFRAEWKEVHGSPDSSEIAILPPEGKFTPITVSMEDSQFLETRKYNGIVIAQWYNLPPNTLKDLDNAHFTNIEQEGINFVVSSLMPWPKKQEDELNRKLLTREERREYFIEHNFAGLLRGDQKSRLEAYMIGLQNGLYTINECRRLENLNGIGPAGDQHFVQLNMTTAERILTEAAPQQALAKPAAVPAASLATWPPARQLLDLRAPVDPDAAAIVALVREAHTLLVEREAAAKAAATVPAANGDQIAEDRRTGLSLLIEEQAAAAAQVAKNAAAKVAAKAVLRDALSRMFGKEANAVRKAIKNKSLDFDAWLLGFHAKHAATVTQALAPAIDLLASVGVHPKTETAGARCVRASGPILRTAFDSDTPAAFAARLAAWPETMSREIVGEIAEGI
jgi:HK97 family phage portal protein